jgi:hypothetical protein
MKDILGHKSRDRGEIVEILARAGTYTCPTLPHYRYSRVQQACKSLRKVGLIKASGRSPESVSYATTDLFRAWKAAVLDGQTMLGPIKWIKAQTPTIPKENADADVD